MSERTGMAKRAKPRRKPPADAASLTPQEREELIAKFLKDPQAHDRAAAHYAKVIYDDVAEA